MAISLYLHRWDGSKFLQLDNMYHRHTAFLLLFDGHPATLHLTRDDVDDFLWELNEEFGMNIDGAKIVEIQLPTLAEQFMQEESEGNVKEAYLLHDPRGNRKDKE